MSVITKLTSAFAQSHILGMMMDIYNMIPAGGVCYFADKNALKGTLLENIQHYRWISISSLPPEAEMISSNSDQRALWEFRECGKR